MFCNQCGAALTDGAAFCPKCGRSIGGTAAAPVEVVWNRVAGNHVILGALWLVEAAFGLLVALGLFGVSAAASLGRLETLGTSWGGASSYANMAVAGAVLTFVGLIALIVTAFGAFIGFGLVTLKPWARVAGIVGGILILFHPPLGTALGIYTLIVLAPAASGAEFSRLAQSRTG